MTIIKEFIKGTVNVLNLFSPLEYYILIKRIHTKGGGGVGWGRGGEGELQDSIPRLNVEKLAICLSYERKPCFSPNIMLSRRDV